jgi:hypothetical protein
MTVDGAILSAAFAIIPAGCLLLKQTEKRTGIVEKFHNASEI